MGQVVEEVNNIDDRGGEAAKFVKDTSGVGWEGWRRMGLRLEIPKTLSHRHSPFHPNRRLFSLGTFLAPPQKKESPLLPPLLPWGFSEVILMAFGGGIDTSKREEEEEEIPLLQKKSRGGGGNGKAIRFR